MAEPAQPAWFDDLLERHYRPIIAFAVGLLGDTQQAHDIAQEVFIAAWRAAQQQKAPFTAMLDEEGAHHWLYRVAYNRVISMRRHASIIMWEPLEEIDSRSAAPASPTSPASAGSRFEDQIAEGDALATALATLSQQDAACVLLHVVHGFTTSEVAGILGISPVAAKKRVWRATERLRAAYVAHNEIPAQGKRGRS